MFKRHLIEFLSLVVLLASGIAMAADDPVRIVVRTTDAGGLTTYNYTVINPTSQRIVALRIGLDYLHGVAELRTPPIGWTLERGLTSSSVTSPAGWTASLITEEESEYFNLEWTSSTDASFDIAPGATTGGFVVQVPSAATEYRLPQFDVVFGNATHAYGRVQPANGKPRAVRH
jgi:hypothetical protein